MKKLLLIFLTLTLQLSAQSIVAHRGVAHKVPQNTFAAFEKAWDVGVDFIEADFHLTKDNKVVCFHDKDTRSLSGKKITLKHATWKQLQLLDIGTTATTRDKGHRMPLLHEVLKTVPTNKGIFIELKSSDQSIVTHVKKVIEQSRVSYSQIHFISFHPKILTQSKSLMPQAKTQWLIKVRSNRLTGSPAPSFKQIMLDLNRFKFDGIGTNIHKSVLTPSNLKHLQKAGFYWNIWTVNSPQKAKKLQAYGIDFITTDTPSACK